MLEIRNLSVSFGQTRILKDINMTLTRGECLALIGESGTGKTTLGRSIIGLGDGECTGEILYRGRNLLGLTEREMSEIRWNQIAMVFQNVENALNPLYTILGQVMEPMVEHGLYTRPEAKIRAGELLRRVGISPDFHSFYPHQLSGGQKQRALIAMALANDPELLIMDEPTSALDPITKAEIIKLLQQIGRQHTMLVITHDFSTAATLAQKTAVLYGGRIVELGPTGLILSSPKHPYTRGLLRAYPNMTTTKDLQGIPGRLSRPNRGCPFAPRCTQSMPACSQTCPELIENGGRMVACHLGGIVPLLEVKNVGKSFGRLRAVEKISLTLYEGETVALVGESGSGKTTLARIITGSSEPSEGLIFLNGRPVERRGKDFYRQVQMIYQNPAESISHRQTVLEAVSEPLEIHEVGDRMERREKVKRVLEEVELPATEEFLLTYPHHLSGGEAQRVAIARALILAPKLLIADEPTSALDPSVQAKILKLLLNLQEKKGLSLLFITHDIALARKVSDRIIVLREGRVVEEGPSHRVTSMPKHPYTRSLLAAAPSLDVNREWFALQYNVEKCSTA
ncbi:ABC transporter ATP-binding protein [Thermincola potens]|uniref:Oligopeptide/dipeptide ABC transporter, ATPase subunit n=1 Tax=Thermincola potens (strain JR) TaxID=635013 RepID=D5XEN5_THEPJ|nr:ABC transporter ATP-binding protein [Thermincola potens]ADG82106.1 oligopeptide/dipeptide ABC transporter, ATPase subunit [Thermincola potens JR]